MDNTSTESLLFFLQMYFVTRLKLVFTTTTTTTTILWPSGFFPELPGLAGTRKVKPGRQNQSGFTGATDSEWQWHEMGYMQIYSSPQTDNHATIPSLSFLQTRCPSCRPTNSVKALKAFTRNLLKCNSDFTKKSCPTATLK